MNIYLDNKIINDVTLSDAEIGVYIALRSIYQSNRESQYVSFNMIAYELYGIGDFKRSICNHIKSSLNCLIEKGYITVICKLSTTEFILDLKKLYIDTNKENTYYTVVYDDEVHSILNLNTKADKLKMLRYFVICMCSICRTLGVYTDCYSEKINFVGFMTQEYLCNQTGIHINNILHYNKILMENHLLYIYKHDEMKRASTGEFSSFSNHYGRYEDKEDIIAFAKNYEKTCGINEKIVQSAKANHKRSVSAKYNNLYRDTDKYVEIYSGTELIEIFEQVHHDNALIEEELANTKEGSEYYDKLLNKLRNEDVFDNIPCVVKYINRRYNLVSTQSKTDDWGEPDPMENDIPVENNEPVVCEVQSDLAKETNPKWTVENSPMKPFRRYFQTLIITVWI